MRKMKKSVKIVILLILLVGLSFGVYKLYKWINPPKDIVEFRKRIEDNEKLIKEHNDQYDISLISVQERQRKELEEMDAKVNDVPNAVSNMNVSFVGDSVMLGAVRELGKTFPNSLRDAETSRSLLYGLNLIKGLQDKGTLGDAVVINLGANGDCLNGCKESFMDYIDKSKQVFWMTVTDDYKVHINDKLKELDKKYDNLHVIDWETLSAGQEDWFYADGIHLPYTGQVAYTKVIYDALCEFYKNEFVNQREKLVKKHEAELKEGYEVFGNELFINMYSDVKDKYNNVKINSKSKYKDKDILSDISNNKDKIKNNVLLMFDKESSLSKKDYEKIISELGNRKIYLVDLEDKYSDLSSDNVAIIKLDDDEEYYLSDKVHLSSKGNEALIKLLNDKIKIEDTVK